MAAQRASRVYSPITPSRSFSPIAAGEDAAVHGQDLAGDEIRRGGTEEDCGADQLVRLAEAAGGGAAEDPAVAGLEIGMGLQSGGQVCRDPARREGVDLDVVL